MHHHACLWFHLKTYKKSDFGQLEVVTSCCLQRPVEAKGICPQSEEELPDRFLQATGLEGPDGPIQVPWESRL